MTQLEKLMKAKPDRYHFEVSMEANSTTAIYVDIDTHLVSQRALHIVGLVWLVQSSSDNLMLPVAVNTAQHLQLQRVDDGVGNTGIVSILDGDLIAQDIFIPETSSAHSWPRTVEVDDFTTFEKMRIVYDTQADETAWSGPPYTLRGYVEAHIITAPKDGRYKNNMKAEDI